MQAHLPVKKHLAISLMTWVGSHFYTNTILVIDGRQQVTPATGQYHHRLITA